MPALNLDLDYFDHPKTKRLVGLLGRGAEVLPIKLWAFCGKFHAESGRLTGYAAQEIESIVGWWGRPGDLMAALVRVGFVRQEGEEDFVVHEWAEHEGHIAAFKVRAKRAAGARWSRLAGSDTDATSNASSIAKEERKQCPIPTKPTNHNPPTPKGVPDGFAAFWSAWPRHERKGDKAKCIKHWFKHDLEHAAGAVMRGLEAWKVSRTWQKDDGQFIPAPLVWLRGNRWEQEPAPDPTYGDAPPDPDTGFVRKVTPEMLEAISRRSA